MVDYYGAQKAIPTAASARSGAPAYADLLLAHASRARWMEEWTFGASVTGADRCAPIPAHADDSGHDHSGGIMGTPIRRPLWSCSFGMPDAVLSALLVNNGRAPAATLLSTAVSGQKAFVYGPDGVLANVWIPGCPKDSLAHRRAVVSMSVYASHAATLYVQVQDSPLYSKVLNAAAFNDISLDDEVSLTPGEYNEIPFTAWIQGTTAGATWVVTLCSISINQQRTSP